MSIVTNLVQLQSQQMSFPCAFHGSPFVLVFFFFFFFFFLVFT
jgi:hypothetical protein